MTTISNGIVRDPGRASPPTGARRVLALDFYDGPTGGVLEADTGDEYRFNLADEDELSRAGERSFSLRPMPRGSLDRLVAVIGPYFPPKWPLWFPIWHFVDGELQRRVESETDTILELAGAVEWLVKSSDQWELARFSSTARTAAPALDD